MMVMSTAPHSINGSLRMVFECDSRGRSILCELYRQAPVIVQQALYFDEMLRDMACVYILSSGGPVIGGDNFRYSLTLRRGAMAHISTGAATKIAAMHNRVSSLEQHITLDDDAYMEYLPEPMIPCRGARYRSATHIEIAPTATLLMSEITLSGRRYYASGERFTYESLTLLTESSRPDGERLFRDRSVIIPSRGIEGVGAMGRWEIFASLYVLTPEPHAEALYSSFQPYIDHRKGVAVAILRLPRRAGLLFRILGNDSQIIKLTIRELASRVRLQVKGVRLDEDFPWR